MYLCSTGVYSRDCLSRACTFLAAEWRAVIGMIPRSQEKSLHEALCRYTEIGDGPIEIDVDILCNFIVDNLHDHSLWSFIADEPQTVAQYPVALFFTADSGFVYRTYESSPLINRHDLLNEAIELDNFTIDVRFLSEFLVGQDYDALVKVVRDPEEGVVFTEVGCTNGPAMRAFGEIALSVETSVNGALYSATRGTVLDYFCWALRQRFSFTGSVDGIRLPSNGLDEDETMERMLTSINDYSASVRRRVAVFEFLVEPR